MNSHNKLESIIEINKTIHKQIQKLVEKDLEKYKRFGVNNADVAKQIINEKYELIEFPIKNNLLAGIIVRKNESFYYFVNSSIPRTLQNLLHLHGLYYLLHGDKKDIYIIKNEIETSVNINNRKAIYYASLMMLDKESIRSNYYYLKNDRKLPLKLIVYNLMMLYKTTYHTILIRLFEIKCIERFDILEDCFKDFDNKRIHNEFKEIGLDTCILESSNTKSMGNLKLYVEQSRNNNNLLEDFININISEYNNILKELQCMQECK
ncbi:hypothetical protein PV797_19860 [Clostridiaceae bacterium M8S5]|nr:hypothetical protein PV797_19860 [Clostridiaceae bacterium M8S5]